MRKFITVDEAINLLPEGDYIHTFSNLPFGLLGVDCSREDVIDKFKTSDKIELTGEQARGLGHGLAVYNNDTKKQSEILFIETDMKKLLSFDPKTVGLVYRRDFDCCTECAKAIEHRLIMIENNWLWHGKNPNRRYKNWGMPEPTSEQVEKYCRERCLTLVSNEFMAHIIADSGESIRTIPSGLSEL